MRDPVDNIYPVIESEGPEEELSGFRPARLDEFIGQNELKSKLEIYIQAARKRRAAGPLPVLRTPRAWQDNPCRHHRQRDAGQLRVTSGPALERTGDLAAILSNLQPGDVLFVDEIHRLSPAIEEVLYPGMEDFSLDIIVGKGPLARNIEVQQYHPLLIGATTRLGLLTSPLRARFGIVEQLELYTAEDISQIVTRGSRLLSVAIKPDAAMAIARVCSGAPPGWRSGFCGELGIVAEVRCAPGIDLALAETALEVGRRL